MTRLEHSVLVNTPVETVESILYDATRFPEWVVGVQQAQPDSVFPNVGGAVDVVYSVVGVSFLVKLYSVEVSPGQSAKTAFEGAINGSNTWAFQPEGGGTWVTCVFEYEVPGGGLGATIDRMVFEKKNAENLEKGLNNLKALAEA
jgi:uncharacterized membrane protein